MIIERIVPTTEVRHEFSSTPVGDYTCEAGVMDNGDLKVNLIGCGPNSEGKVIAIRFNRYETTKIRSALGKGGS